MRPRWFPQLARDPFKVACSNNLQLPLVPQLNYQKQPFQITSKFPWFPQLNYQPNYFKTTLKLPFKLPLRSRSSTQKAPRDSLVYLRFCRFLRRFFIRYQTMILKKKSQLPLNSRSSTQKAPRDTLVYLRFCSFLRRFFIRYQNYLSKIHVLIRFKVTV